MSVDIIRSAESIRDVENISHYFVDQKSPATALEFSSAVTATLENLASFPEMGPLWESKSKKLKGMRFQNVRGFKNYLIFYRVTDHGLHVERIIDGRRELAKLL